MAPHLEANRTARSMTPASRSPQRPCSVKKASRSVSRLTPRAYRGGRVYARFASGEPTPSAVIVDRPVLLLDLQPAPRRPALVRTRLVLGGPNPQIQRWEGLLYYRLHRSVIRGSQRGR